MAKLYPPQLDNIIPSFTGNKIIVPFSWNRSVSKNEVFGFSIKIKKVLDSELVLSLVTNNYDITNGAQAIFSLSEDQEKLFTVGQYYKIQLAFMDDKGFIGYYSSVATMKRTSEPTIGIAELKTGMINPHVYHYTGTYSQKDGDPTEKMYSCKFSLYDSKYNLLSESPDIYHTVMNDESPVEAYERYTISYDLQRDLTYYMRLEVTTTGGAKFYSPYYRVMQIRSIQPELNATFTAKMNYYQGIVNLRLDAIPDAEGRKRLGTGKFILSRAASNEDYVWREIGAFMVDTTEAYYDLWTDYTVEQGVTYKYSIQQYNSYNIYSERLESNEVYGDFEDAFLFDGKRQLNIRFNPKVSYKLDVLEQKQDTIGSKHPFISRNAAVHYYEFSISGLISYLQDEEELFMSKEDLGVRYNSTNLTSENMYAERIFRKEVLEWLNNGQNKLFRTPAEGNYIVRLMNVSLSPQANLSNMLYTFNCTAYEVEDCTYEKLEEMGFVPPISKVLPTHKWTSVLVAGHSQSLEDAIKVMDTYFFVGLDAAFGRENVSRILNSLSSTVDKLDQYFNSKYELLRSTPDNVKGTIKNLKNKYTIVTGVVNNYPAYSIKVTDMLPGTLIQLDDEVIQVGGNGSYILMNLINPIQEIRVLPKEEQFFIKNQDPKGVITYEYIEESSSTFELIRSNIIEDVPIQQWVGSQAGTYYDTDYGVFRETENILKLINNEAREVFNISMLRFRKRDIEIVFQGDNGKFYWDMDCTDIVDIDKLNPLNLYAIFKRRTDYTYSFLLDGYYVDANLARGYYVNTFNNKIEAFTGKYYDAKLKTIISQDNYSTAVEVDGAPVDIGQTERLVVTTADVPVTDIKSIKIGNGVVCEMSYQAQIIGYSMDKDNMVLKSYYDAYNGAKNIRRTYLNSLNRTSESLADIVKAYDQRMAENNNAIKNLYNQYITQLRVSIKHYKEENRL